MDLGGFVFYFERGFWQLQTKISILCVYVSLMSLRTWVSFSYQQKTGMCSWMSQLRISEQLHFAKPTSFFMFSCQVEWAELI